MRVALLSDIHGNLFALEAVLSVLAREQVDQLVCLGDVALFGPQPRETLARIEALACPVVMGNTDAWALDPQPHPIRNAESEFFNAIELWGAQQLTDTDRAYIRTFQATVELPLGERNSLLCYHGSPKSYKDVIVATTPDAMLAPLIGEQDARVLAGGHTHAQYVRRYQDKLLLNPGSVGLPYEMLPDGTNRNPPWAEYAIIEWEKEDLHVTLRRAAYDLAPLLAMAKASGMPCANWWCKDWR
ncbi:MAG: metallophosphoesterase family protein [Caldilineaceae bacterium]